MGFAGGFAISAKRRIKKRNNVSGKPLEAIGWKKCSECMR
jgi:hypothetical protein